MTLEVVVAAGGGKSGASPGSELRSAITHAPQRIKAANTGAITTKHTMLRTIDLTVMLCPWAMASRIAKMALIDPSATLRLVVEVVLGLPFLFRPIDNR